MCLVVGIGHSLTENGLTLLKLQRKNKQNHCEIFPVSLRKYVVLNMYRLHVCGEAYNLEYKVKIKLHSWCKEGGRKYTSPHPSSILILLLIFV